MANRTRVQEVDTITEGRRGLAAELRDLADRLDGEEPDYSALHDAWEVLVELGDEVESLRVQFFNRHPEQKALLIEKRPWLDPKLELIGKPSAPRGQELRAPGENRRQLIVLYRGLRMRLTSTASVSNIINGTLKRCTRFSGVAF